MLLRAVLLVGGVALLAFGLARHSRHDACATARRDSLSIGLGHTPASAAPRVATRLAADCRDVAVLSEGVASLLRVHQTGPALRLAQDAVRREPEGRNGWIALSWVRRDLGDAAGQARALERARRLDPVGLRG